MIKFFLLSSLAHLYLVMSSSNLNLVMSSLESTQYNDYGLMSAYLGFSHRSSPQNYFIFSSYVKRYYMQSPIDCLKLLEHYRNNRIFNVLFWNALDSTHYDWITPSKITPGYYSKVLKWISQKIRITFLLSRCSDESKFKTDLEIISLLIRLAERTAFELKSLGIKDDFINEFYGLAAIWKYLIRNISFDFDNKTIDYYSLFRTINELRFLANMDSSSISPPLRISKRYALLWFYMRYIYVNECAVIFGKQHYLNNINAFSINLIMGLRHSFYNQNANECPNELISQFEKLIKGGSLQKNVIKEILERFDLRRTCLLLGNPKNVSNFSELAYFLDNEHYEKGDPSMKWRVRALGELERYLVRISQN